MTTQYRKGRNGAEATTYVDIPGSEVRKLPIHTSKSSRKTVSTFASVAEHKDGFTSFVMFQDYSEIVADEAARCTAANVAAQHQRVLERVPEILAKVAQHYSEERLAKLARIRGTA